MPPLPQSPIAPADFRCRRCGNCCRHPGEVRLTAAEVADIARHVGLTDRDFASHYTRLREDRQGLALTERTDGTCIFLTEDPPACRIQPVKPAQCRGFPFTWRYDDLERVCPTATTLSRREPSPAMPVPPPPDPAPP